jgi:hypothetical protein
MHMQPNVQQPETQQGFQPPTHEQVARRAYELYLERGCQPGHEVDDWLQAEYELMRLPIRKIAEMERPKRAPGPRRKKSVVDVVHTALML